MKRLLNDPVMNDTGWSDYNKKVKQEINLQSDNRGTCLKWHPSCHHHCTLESLTSMALFWLPYLRWPYLQWPYLQGSGQMFSSRSLLGLLRLSNKCVTDQFRTALIRRLKKLSLSLVASIINPAKREWLWCTRLLFLRYALSLHSHSSSDLHWAYKTYYLYCKCTPNLHGLVEPPRTLRFT